MILKRITLENIRSYTNQTISFPQGTVLLSGDIGSGKSSILLAIEFALFGVRRDLSASGLLRNGEKKGFVELAFCVDDKDVVIRRTLKRGSESIAQEAGYIVINGRQTDATAIELKSMVLDILQYPKESLTKSKSLMWRYTVYTPQEEMKQILFEAREARVETLRQIFGIDKYKRVAANAQLYTKHLREERKVLELQSRDEDVKRKECVERQDTRYKLSEEYAILIPAGDELKARIVKKKQEIRALQENLKLLADIRLRNTTYQAQIAEKKALLARTRNEANELAQKIEQMGARVEAMPQTSVPPNAVNALEEEILRQEEELRLVQTQRSQTKERLSFVERRLGELSAEVRVKNTRLESMSDKKDAKEALLAQVKDKHALSHEIAALEHRMSEMNSLLREYQVLKKQADDNKNAVLNLDECPTCKQVVAQDHKHVIVTKEDERIEALNRAIHELTEEQAALAESLNRQKQVSQAINNAEQALAGLTAELNQLEVIAAETMRLEKLVLELAVEKQTAFDILTSLEARNVEEERAQILAKRERLKQLQEERLAVMERSQLLRSLEEKKQLRIQQEEAISHLQTEVSELEMLSTNCVAQLETHQHFEQQVQKLGEELDALETEERLLHVKLAQLHERIEGQNQFISQLEAEILAKAAARKQSENIKILHHWLDEFFVNLMGTLEQHMMLTIYEQFNECFTSWFATLIEDESLSIRLDLEFSPVVLQNGYEIDVEHLSGGEKTAVALAYRLALNKVINDVVSQIKTKELMILDEPTDGFSSEQLDRLKDVLDSLGIRQVIMVSHESKIEGMVDRVIRIAKGEHVSRVLS